MEEDEELVEEEEEGDRGGGAWNEGTQAGLHVSNRFTGVKQDCV